MAKKTNSGKSNVGGAFIRKRRTREHIIAALSANYVERLALKCGYVVREEYPDYSLDLRMQTFDEKGNAEGEHVWLQLKATDNIQEYELQRQDCLSFPVQTKDYRYWVEVVVMPVFLVGYDAIMEEGYWLDIQAYREVNRPALDGRTVQVRIPHTNVLGVQTMRMMRKRKQQVIQEWKQMR